MWKVAAAGQIFEKKMIHFKDLANLENLLLLKRYWKCFLCCLLNGKRMHLNHKLPQAKNFCSIQICKEKLNWKCKNCCRRRNFWKQSWFISRNWPEKCLGGRFCPWGVGSFSFLRGGSLILPNRGGLTPPDPPPCSRMVPAGLGFANGQVPP